MSLSTKIFSKTVAFLSFYGCFDKKMVSKNRVSTGIRFLYAKELTFQHALIHFCGVQKKSAVLSTWMAVFFKSFGNRIRFIQFLNLNLFVVCDALEF